MRQPRISDSQMDLLAERLGAIGVGRRDFLRVAAGLATMGAVGFNARPASSAPKLAPGEKLAKDQTFRYGGGGADFYNYKTQQPVGSFAGQIVAIADVLGDWREELICSVEGKLQIVTTTIPATTRHASLMQDSLYRNEVSHVSMGYLYWPNPSVPLFP